MKTSASEKKLKYRINEQIELLPRTISITDIQKALKQLGISKDAFYRDRQIEAESNYSIPSDRLDAYATLFGCTPDELKNYKVKGKSLIERFHKNKVKSGLQTLLLLALIALPSCVSYKGMGHCPTYSKHVSKSITPKHLL